MRIPARFVVLLLGVVGHATMSGTRLVTSLFALHEGATPLVVGGIFALYSLAPTLVAMPLGRLIDRSGALKPMMVCCLSMAFGLALLFGVPGLASLVIAAPIIGTAFSSYNIGINNLTGQIGTSAERTSSFGWLSMGFATGSLTGPLIAGSFIDLFGHRATFGSLAVIPVVGTLLIFSQRGWLPSGKGEGKAKSGKLRDLLSAPGVAAVILVAGLFTAVWDVFVFVAPLIGREMGLSATAIGVVMGWFAGGSFLARAAIPWLAKRFDDWTLMSTTFFLCAIGFSIMPFAGDSVVLSVAAAFVGLGTGFGTPLSFSLGYTVSPPGRQGELGGARAVINSVCHSTVPLAVGGLSAATGFAPIMLAVAVVNAASGWFSLRQRSSGEPGAASPADRRA